MEDGEYVEDFKKKVEVRPCTKKMVGNRPVSIVSNVSKVYKGCLYDQVYDFLKINFLDIHADFVKVSIPKMQFFPW